VFFLPDAAYGVDQLGFGSGAEVLVPVVVGGALYTLGGILYP
jgi:hypothetical protein